MYVSIHFIFAPGCSCLPAWWCKQNWSCDCRSSIGLTCPVISRNSVLNVCPVSPVLSVLPLLVKGNYSQFMQKDHWIAADITELPVTSLGNRYVLVVIDYFTSFVNLYPLKDQRATTVAQCIFEDYIKQPGVPEIIHMDQGRHFESDLMKHLCS